MCPVSPLSGFSKENTYYPISLISDSSSPLMLTYKEGGFIIPFEVLENVINLLLSVN